MNVFKELYQNRKLIWKLSKNDFRNKFAGAYFGIIWAFIQPMVTVAVYFVVFQLGLRVQPAATGYPYICWLVSGIIPWFFFSDALPSASNCLLEYSYLVKKVVFKISILPIIKLVAATFIHAFFVGVLLIIAMMYGYMPNLYTLQIFYYSFCLFVLMLAMSYCTCAIVVFFRDLAQIINIGLQVGMWATPILWNIGMLENYPKLRVLFKLNPLTYIVNGYRSAIYEESWFFEHFYSSTYFWIFTVTLFCVGSLIFKRLKVHFADVL